MSKWEFKNQAVEANERTPAAKQIGSKGVIIGFGPPKFQQGAKVVLCGFIQSLNLNQQKQVQEIFEIGSGERFYTDGPTRNMLSISRALFSGPSLLKMMGTGLTGRGIEKNSSDISGISSEIFESGGSIEAAATDFDDVHWMNLSSSFFNNPLGVLLRYGTFDGQGNYEIYSETYLENCKIQALSTNMQAGRWLTQEQVQIQFANPKPISGTTVDDYYKDRNGLIKAMHDNQNESTNFDDQNDEL